MSDKYYFECHTCHKKELISDEYKSKHLELFKCEIVCDLAHLCDECEYKGHLNALPMIYRNGDDKFNFVNKIPDYNNKSLFLYGEPGSGKTFMATMILKYRWRKKLSGIFISFPEFIFGIQTDYDNKASNVDYYKKQPGCIVIDDFGAEKMTDFVRQVSYLIINYREQNRLQTIITSNFTLDEIDQFVDRRISSRIGGWCRVVKMTGDKRIKVKSG